MRASITSFSASKIPLWAIASIPLILSCIAWFAPAAPHRMETPPKLQSLAFDQYVLDLRRVTQRPRDMHYFYFAFRNVGDHPLKITSMSPSCGCLQPIVTKKDSTTFEPNESGEILLRIHAASQDPGEREFWVDVNYEDPEPHQRRIALKMTLPKEQVWIQPKGLIFYPGRSGGTIPPQEITVTDLRADRISIIGLSCDDPYVKYDLLKPEPGNNDPKTVVGKIQVSLQGPIPAGKRQSIVKIYTDDPHQQYHELRVPIMISPPTITADRTLSINAD